MGEPSSTSAALEAIRSRASATHTDRKVPFAPPRLCAKPTAHQAFRPLSLRERPSGRPWQSLQPINHTPIVIPAKAGISRSTNDTPSRRIPPYRPEGPFIPFLWKKKRYGQKKPISGSDAVASHPELPPEWESRVPPRPHSKRSAPARPQPIPTGRSPSRLRDSARNPPHTRPSALCHCERGRQADRGNLFNQ